MEWLQILYKPYETYINKYRNLLSLIALYLLNDALGLRISSGRIPYHLGGIGYYLKM